MNLVCIFQSGISLLCLIWLFVLYPSSLRFSHHLCYSFMQNFHFLMSEKQFYWCQMEWYWMRPKTVTSCNILGQQLHWYSMELSSVSKYHPHCFQYGMLELLVTILDFFKKEMTHIFRFSHCCPSFSLLSSRGIL